MTVRLAFFAFSFALCGAASAQSSDVSIRQVGALNTVESQLAASSLSLEQSGTQNEAFIEQVGAGGHTVRLTQDGGSLAEILQDGTDHQLVGLAGGAAVQESGSLLRLSQSGAGNTLFLNQTDGAYAEVTQSGAGNTVTAIQAASHSP